MMETEAGNIVIAAFMGKAEVLKEWEGVVGADNLQYHSSWDWLMPVLKKIQPIPTEWPRKKIVMNAVHDLDIKTAWLAAVQFIEWYNQNKKDNL